MVQREESKRSMMNTQPHKLDETKTFAIRQPKPNPNFSTMNWGNQILLKCEHYKSEGHKEEDCWFLHPELGPKGRGRGGEGDDNFKISGDGRSREKSKKNDKRILGAISEETK
jgi:hypothetical protein